MPNFDISHDAEIADPRLSAREAQLGPSIQRQPEAAKRVAIYVRYAAAPDGTNPAEDNADRCQAFSERQGWAVASIFQDLGRSGASVSARHGLLAMMAAADDGEFD